MKDHSFGKAINMVIQNHWNMQDYFQKRLPNRLWIMMTLTEQQ